MHLSFLNMLLAVFTQAGLAQEIPPTRFGILLFPGFQVIDAFGPLDVLNILAWRTTLNLSIIAATLDPVPSTLNAPPMNNASSSFGEYILPTHTFDNFPPDLEVLLIPGGLGNRLPSINSAVDFVRVIYPQLRYLITVCTGSAIAARAGVLDGKKATTNKWAFYQTAAWGPKTHWVAKARWVVDGNIWSSSGVSAGIDVTLAWVAHLWGYETAKGLAIGMEYEWHEDAAWDPFSAIKGVVDVVSGTTMFPTSTSVSTVTSPSPSSLGGSSTSTSTVTVTKVVTAIPSSCLNSSKTTKTTKTTKTAKSSKTTKATSPTKT